MTPQEQQLVAELFDRLSKLENAPRDPDAERLIADGARRAPHALYALVQTALVQDEALKRADTRIQDLQQQLEGQFGGEQPEPQQGSFLDAMRDAVFGRNVPHDAPQGSVPGVRAPQGSNPSQAEYASPRLAPAYPTQPGVSPQPAYPAGTGVAPGGGGSFLGTAASAAAGAIGGGLLLNGIRSMFSNRSGSGGNDPFAFASKDQASSGRGDAADSDLARQAGIDDIGRRDTTGNRDDEPNVTDAPDAQFADDVDDNVDDGDFDTADIGSDDDSYDV